MIPFAMKIDILSGMKESHISSLKMHLTCTGVFRQSNIICYASLQCYCFGVHAALNYRYRVPFVSVHTYMLFTMWLATLWSSQIIFKLINMTPPNLPNNL